MLDLRLRGKVGRIGMCGTDGTKLPAIRAHMQSALGDMYTGIDPGCIETWPRDDVVDAGAYREAIAAFAPGSVAIIFTPDDTHDEIATACLARGLHVLVTKPPVKTLAAHTALAARAAAQRVLCAVEVHKRYDPIYVDARDRVPSLGPFSYFTAHMSQPKHQLDTFSKWAGRSSDISYYLNSHRALPPPGPRPRRRGLRQRRAPEPDAPTRLTSRATRAHRRADVDFHEWCMRGRARPESVTAFASDGVAEARLGRTCEDTITLAVRWRNRAESAHDSGDDVAGGAPRAPKRAKTSADAPAEGGGGAAPPRFTGSLGHATYTSSWVAAKADVHSQQRWFCACTALPVAPPQERPAHLSARAPTHDPPPALPVYAVGICSCHQRAHAHGACSPAATALSRRRPAQTWVTVAR